MPPKKHKPNADFDLRSDHVATVPSNDGDITTSTDTNNDSFSYPNVMLMTIAKLKSELNCLQVCMWEIQERPFCKPNYSQHIKMNSLRKLPSSTAATIIVITEFSIKARIKHL